MLNRLWLRAKRWYQGEIKFGRHPSMPGPYPVRHWTAEAAEALAKFYLRNRKWLWGIPIGLYIAGRI